MAEDRGVPVVPAPQTPAEPIPEGTVGIVGQNRFYADALVEWLKSQEARAEAKLRDGSKRYNTLGARAQSEACKQLAARVNGWKRKGAGADVLADRDAALKSPLRVLDEIAELKAALL